MPTLLILAILGSEIRQFGHSGLITSLLEEDWHIIIAAKKADENLRASLDPRVQITKLPTPQMSFWSRQLQLILDQAFDEREQKTGRNNWSYKKPTPPHKLTHRIISVMQSLGKRFFSSSFYMFHLGESLEKKLLGMQNNTDWKELYDNFKPDVVLVNVPKAGSLSSALFVAHKLGILTALFYHTWKDVTTASGRLTHSFTSIGVWNNWMKNRLLLQYSSLTDDDVSIVGCAHFDPVIQTDTLWSEKEFKEYLGLDIQKKIILFTASAPWVVPDEHIYVQTLYEAIGNQLPEDIQIVVRLNPMDETDEMISKLATYCSGVVALRPNWYWDKKSNWCYQQKDDSVLYNNLLYYSAVNVSVPSTVTVECAIADIPVVNIGYTLDGMRSPMRDIKEFWNADFYKDIRLTGAARLAESETALFDNVNQFLADLTIDSQSRTSLVGHQLGIAPGKAANEYRAILNEIAKNRLKTN